MVANQSGQRRVVVGDSAASGLGHDGPGVAQLSARLSIKGSRISEDLQLARACSLTNGSNRRLGAGLFVTDEGGRPDLVCNGSETGGVTAGDASVSSRPGQLALALHSSLESLEVHGEAPLCGYLPGQVDRESKGVVELEGGLTR